MQSLSDNNQLGYITDYITSDEQGAILKDEINRIISPEAIEIINSVRLQYQQLRQTISDDSLLSNEILRIANQK